MSLPKGIGVDSVDLPKILSELHDELTRTEQAIAALERLVASKEKRRGRPPKWLQAVRQKQQTGSTGHPPPEPLSRKRDSTRTKAK